MVKWCAVRNCQSGSRTEAKCSMFHVPKDPVMWKKWEEAIPGSVKLKRTDVVCEKHFDDNDISREWIKLDANGQIIARATYKCPRLKNLAVPTKFVDVAIVKDNFGLFHNYAKRLPTSHLVPAKDNCANSSRNSPSISHQPNISGESSSSMKPSVQVISTVVDFACAVSNDVSTCEPDAADSLPHHEIFEVPSSPSIGEQTPEQNESTSADFSAYVPESWSVGQSRTENGQYTYFSYSISKMGNTDPCPVIQKCVTLDAHGTLKYFVYGRRVDMPETEVERVFRKKEKLPNVLGKFKRMGVCSGLGNIHIHLVTPGEAYQDCVEKWRSKDCSLLSKKKRCDPCARSRRCIAQRASRLRNQETIKRIGRVSNPVDRRKLQAMQKKIRREICKKIRAKDRVKHLTTCMKAQEEQRSYKQV